MIYSPGIYEAHDSASEEKNAVASSTRASSANREILAQHQLRVHVQVRATLLPPHVASPTVRLQMQVNVAAPHFTPSMT